MAAGQDQTANGTEFPTDHIKAENVETGETYYIDKSTGLEGADLPAGEYVVTYYDGEEVVRERVRIDSTGDAESIGTASGSIGSASHTSGITIAIGKTFEGSYDSNATVNIWAGVTNASTPVPTPQSGVNLTISVQRPDGTIDTFNRTTGPEGSVNLSYSLEGKSDGEYDVTVDAANYSEEFERFTAGPFARTLYPGIAYRSDVNTSTNVSLLVTEGSAPAAGVSKNVTIRQPDGNTTTRQVTTDSNGFATFTFSPSQVGDYDIYSENFNAYESYYVGSGVGTTYVNGNEFGDRITPNNTATIAGEIQNGSGLAANKSITVSIVNTTNFSNVTVATNISTTTDSVGQYLVTWDPGSDQTGDFDIRVYDAEGRPVATGFSDIQVVKPQDDGDGGSTYTPPALQLDLESTDFDYTAEPGSTLEFTVTVTENDTAVANTNVTIGTFYGTVPTNVTTLTTNSTGMATYTVSISESAPDHGSVEIQAFTAFNGSTADDFYYADIQRFRLEQRQSAYRVVGGGAVNVSLIARNGETGAGVSDVPTTLAGENGPQINVFQRGSQPTGSTGAANYTVTIPDVPTREAYAGLYAEYAGSYEYAYFQVQDYRTEVRGIDEFQYNAGETVTFNYTANTSQSVSAIVVVSSYDTVESKTLLATRASSGEQLSFTVPTDVPDETDYQVQVIAASEGGDLAVAREYFEVNATTTDTTSRVNVTGTFEDASGNALADDVVVSNGAEARFERSNSTGAFDIALLPNETYSLTFGQNGSAPNFDPPRDGVADVYKFESSINVSSDTDLGTVTIPNASVLNVQVVNESGAPVEDALVSIRPDNRTGVASSGPLALTDSNGYLQFDNVSGTGIEVTGNVTVLVRPPENSSSYVEDTYSQQLEVTQDTNISVSLNETVSDAVVSGSVQDANGNALANRSVVANGPEFIVNTTNSAGEFGIALTPDTAYSITFVQANDSVRLPRDGVADLYKLEPTVNVSSDTDLGAYTIPNASVLNVRVVNQSGVAVENASVVVYPNNRTGVKSTGWVASTNENGYFESSEGTTGIEVTGNTTVKVRPPRNATGYKNTSYTRLLEVTNDTNVTVTLKEVASVTFANQTSSGSQVTVKRVDLPRGGFVTIHDSSLLDGKPFSSIRGNSTYLAPGVHTGVTVTLDDPITGSGTFYAVARQDTDDDQTYDFEATNGSDDGPYTDSQGSPIVDAGEVTVANATLETSVTDAAPGENATVAFNLTNIGDQDKGFVLNLTNIPENVSVVDQYADGATWSADRTAWTYQTLNSGESVQPNVTLAVPENRTEDITFTAVAKTSDGVAAERTVTITPCQTVTQAVDANDDGTIGDFEILDAIEYWRDGTEVPGTCGETIGDFQILDLIELWRDGGTV